MESEIKLSQGERLILLMLCDIQKHLKMDNAANADFIKDAITTGNLWGLNHEFSGIFHGYETPKVVVDETAKILQMWEKLEESFKELPQADRDALAQEFKPFGPDVRCPGFDGNNESEYLVAARFYVDKLKSFQYLKGRDLNAHMRTIEAHRRMLLVFEPILWGVLDGNLTREQIEAVMAERVHPDNRTKI